MSGIRKATTIQKITNIVLSLISPSLRLPEIFLSKDLGPLFIVLSPSQVSTSRYLKNEYMQICILPLMPPVE